MPEVGPPVVPGFGATASPTVDPPTTALHSGVSIVRLPARSPNLNAFAERFVLSIKSECLDRMVILGERHLRTAIAEYVEHYHRERNHQGLGGRLLIPDEAAGRTHGRVVCRERLGGTLQYYYREAA